jgi:hypothetical protein
MSNLASRSHEWTVWEIKELLVELPLSAQSKGRRREHFRIVLQVTWREHGIQTYTLNARTSPTKTLLNRKPALKQSLSAARILSRRIKDSRGTYAEKNSAAIDKYLTSQI